MSQVTKPMALDETLQDVVSAIQGITRGGMIVSTGNVGSPTQPVYINGGVPTAIEAVDKVKEVRNAYGDANTLNALNTVNFTEIYNGSHTPAASTSESYMYLTGQGGDASNGGVQIAVGAYPSTNDKIFYRRYNGGSWGNWKQLYGIQTGTPTNVHSNLTQGGSSLSYVNKSGNVVDFCFNSTVATAGTIATGTTICKLPYKPVGQSFGIVSYGTFGSGYSDGHYYLTMNYAELKLAAPITFSVNQEIYIRGTYLTND